MGIFKITMNEETKNPKEEISEEEIIRKRTKFFLENNTKIHITCKNGRFYNGKITKIKGDFILIQDTLAYEIPIFFLEIKAIEKYIKKDET